MPALPEITRVEIMKPPASRQIVIAVFLLAAVTFIAFSGSLATIPNTEGWYATVEKVPWDPPNSVFAPAWSVLYFLIALAGWLIWRSGYRPGKQNAAKKPLTIFTLQLILNGLWTPAFFAGYPLMGEPAWWVALVIIIALILTVIWLAVVSARFSKVAAWIMLPYLLWLLFATSLNAGIIFLN